MLGQEVPEPKFWKALVAALIIAIPAILLSHEVFPRSPLWPWLAGGLLLAFCGAYNMHRKAQYDASAQWQMNFAQKDRATYIPPNHHVDDK
jgi:hypothetical protein